MVLSYLSLFSSCCESQLRVQLWLITSNAVNFVPTHLLPLRWGRGLKSTSPRRLTGVRVTRPRLEERFALQGLE